MPFPSSSLCLSKLNPLDLLRRLPKLGIFHKTAKPVKQVLEDEARMIAWLTRVGFLTLERGRTRWTVGSFTHISKVQRLLKEFFRGEEPSKGIDSDSE